MTRFSRLLLATAALAALTSGAVACGSSNTSSSTTAAPGTTAAPASTPPGSTPGSTMSAEAFRESLKMSGISATPEQTDCLVQQVTQNPTVNALFGSSSKVNYAEAQLVVTSFNTCFGSQAATGKALVPLLAMQASPAQAACVGDAIGTISASDFAYLLANQTSSASPQGQAALDACKKVPGTSSTTAG